MNAVKPKLPKWAERKFALMCSDAGVVCQRVEEDETGWDYLVEYPAPPFQGPAEEQPPGRRAFVQIKSTSGRFARTKLKLSNALRAAQDKSPWFIVLVQRHSGDFKFFVLHVWRAEMARVLKRVRAAGIAGEPLHQVMLEFRFSAGMEHSTDLLGWMEQEILAQGDDYETEKNRLFRIVGFEDGAGSGKLTIRGMDELAIERGMIGFGGPLEVAEFTMTPARFGIADAVPRINLKEGWLTVEAEPADVCEFRIRTSDGELIKLSGEVYRSPFHERRLHFTADFLSLVMTEGGNSDLQVRFTRTGPTRVSELDVYCRFMDAVTKGSVDIQIWAKGERMVGGEAHFPELKATTYWESFANICAFMDRLSIEDLSIELADLEASKDDLHIAATTTTKSGMRLEFSAADLPAEKATHLLYYSLSRCGDHSFFSLVERPVQRDYVVAERRCLDVGSPLEREAYVVRCARDKHYQQCVDDYERHLEQLTSRGNPLGLGEIGAFVQALRAERVGTGEPPFVSLA